MTNKWRRWKNIMKAVPFEEKRLTKWQPPYIVQPKYDGFRCRAVPIQTGITSGYILLSSEGNVFFSVPHIHQVLTKLGLRAELDGELYCHGMSFEELSSIVSRTVNLHPDHQKIQFHIFDIVNDQPQMLRMILIDALKGLNHFIRVSPFWLCESLDEVMKAYDKVIELGYEGIIVRHFQGPYERKRSTLIMKFKPKKEDEYEILGYGEELTVSGSPKNTLGYLELRSGDGEVFKVGTGFTRGDRQNLWNIRENLVGKVAKIKYQHLTSGKRVPRFPVFVEVIDERKEE